MSQADRNTPSAAFHSSTRTRATTTRPAVRNHSSHRSDSRTTDSEPSAISISFSSLSPTFGLSHSSSPRHLSNHHSAPSPPGYTTAFSSFAAAQTAFAKSAHFSGAIPSASNTGDIAPTPRYAVGKSSILTTWQSFGFAPNNGATPTATSSNTRRRSFSFTPLRSGKSTAPDGAIPPNTSSAHSAHHRTPL
ncbi:MAG: hypothetical protein IJ884_10445 [Bacteroidales bacterium]|nr:hypothetical protein [Bacteroidales bacterium]